SSEEVKSPAPLPARLRSPSRIMCSHRQAMSSLVLVKARHAYELLARAANKLQAPLLLVMRLYWGWSFFVTGKGKLLNLDKTAEFFGGLGIPFPKFNAALAGSTECLGGLLLLVGLGSRLVSIPLAFMM